MKTAPLIGLGAAIGVLLLLADGCVDLGPGTASPTRLYVLAPLEAGEAGVDHDRLKAASLGVGPLSFPEYLNRPQIVTRVGDSEIRAADFANWGEAMRVDGPHPGDDGARVVTRPRPGHADLAGALKYGTHDARDILERSSARETAARTAARICV